MATDTALEPTDMRAGLSRLAEALLFYLTRGERVSTPFGSFGLTARGTYLDGETPRVETRNIGITFRPDREFLDELRRKSHIVLLRGTRLTFDETDDEQGVFFVSGDDAATRANVYSRHGTTHIDCKVPDLPAGPYRVEVRARSHRGDILIGTAENLVTVQS
jgi:hypothetical protein